MFSRRPLFARRPLWGQLLPAALGGRLCGVVLPHTPLVRPVSRSEIHPHYGGEGMNIGNEVTNIILLLCQKEAKIIFPIRKEFFDKLDPVSGNGYGIFVLICRQTLPKRRDKLIALCF